MFHAVVHICAEASVAKDYSLAGFDEFNSAGLCVRESVALSNLQPLDSSVFITNDPFNVDPQSDGDTLLLGVCKLFVNNFRSGTVDG